jgi:hypothetical protein
MAKRTSVLIEKLVTACNGDLHAALRALLVVNEALDVNFQEVVHSAPAVNADVAKHTVIRGGPNGHSQECASDAERSRGDGAECC